MVKQRTIFLFVVLDPVVYGWIQEAFATKVHIVPKGFLTDEINVARSVTPCIAPVFVPKGIICSKGSDHTFSMFFEEHTGLHIDDQRYRGSGTSKANRMRGFWTVEPDHVVAGVLLAMIAHATEYECVPADMDDALFADVHRIIARLNQNPSSPVPEVDAFTASVNELDFEAAAKHIRTAIEQNEPATALDRLHVFSMKFLRTNCERRGIEVARDKPLHSLNRSGNETAPPVLQSRPATTQADIR